MLNTIYYNEIDSNIENLKLEYNDEYCTKLIAPKQHKNEIKIKMDPTYWYADFEADTSGEVHKPFMVVVQNQRGTLFEEYRGAYDIRFLAAYGIKKINY